MAEQRERSRRRGGGARRARRRDVRSRGRLRTEFVGYEKIDVLTAARRRSRTRRRHVPARSSGSRRSTPRAAARSPTRAGSRSTARGRAPSSSTRPLRRRPGALFDGDGFSAGDRVRAVVAVDGPLPDDGEPHRDAPPARGAARGRSASTCARPARPVRPTSSASTSRTARRFDAERARGGRGRS